MYDYTYDDGGNLTSKTHTIAGTQDYTASYTYDSNMTDLLTGYTKTSSDGTVTTQTYDYTAANGNLYVNPTTITKSTNGTVTDTLSLTWREGRQLSAITSSAGTVKYEYNEDGLRTYRELANGAKRYYYYNGSQLEYIKILNASGALTSTIRYIYNSNGQAEYIMYIKSGNAANPKVYDLYYVLRNNSGVITKLIKVRKATTTSVTPTLEVAVEYTYDPYGKLLATNKVNGDAVGTYNPLVYKDYIYDSETGWYYLQSRYYDPEVGRFLNADAFVTTAQSITDTNMFMYCANNPILYADHSGQFWGIVFGVVVLSAALLLGGCSTNTPPADYRDETSEDHNCYSYAFDLPRTADPGDFSTGDGNPSLYSGTAIPHRKKVANYVLRDMNALGKTVRTINFPTEKADDEYVVAMNVGTTFQKGKPRADYHFAVQLSDGTWADKPGECPSRWNAMDGTAVKWDMYGGAEGYYDSGPIYFAVKK